MIEGRAGWLALAVAIGSMGVCKFAADAQPVTGITLREARRTPASTLADRFLGRDRPEIVEALPGRWWGPVIGADPAADFILLAEAPHPAARSGLCSAHVITLAFSRSGAQAPTRIDNVYFKRASATGGCASRSILPLEGHGYFQGHNLSGTDLSADDAHFAIVALDRARAGGVRIACRDHGAQTKFCGRASTLLHADPLPGMNGVDLSRCGRNHAHICATIDRDMGFGEFVREEVETDAASIGKTGFSVSRLTLSGGTYRREI